MQLKSKQMNFYNFSVKDIKGHDFDLATLKGKKVLVVNTASECGLTPQFQQLEDLYLEFGGENFEIIAFPSNDFGGQEPLSNDDIAIFCSKNYSVSFPMMEKITVLGDNPHPLYKWLKEQLGTEVKWNFQKFLIDGAGAVVKVLDPTILPTDAEIVNWIKE
jgi:glutathione peroxidase